jgi:hypothetical protein
LLETEVVEGSDVRAIVERTAPAQSAA